MSDAPLLEDFRVVDVTEGIAGAYCTKLLAEAGANVVKVEAPTGDPLRTWAAGDRPGGGDGALFQYLHTLKRSWVCTGEPLHDPAVAGLLEGADLLVEGTGAPVDVAAVRHAHPHLDVISISPFGRNAAWSERPVTEFVLQAACGSIGSRGQRDREPLQAGGALGEWIAGAYAAAVAAAFAFRGPAGTGAHADLSMLEAMCLTMAGPTLPLAAALGQPRMERAVELPSVERTKDGFVGFCTITRQQFADFLVMIGAPQLGDDEELATYAGRQRRREEFVRLVEAWTREQLTEDVIELASAMRIPVSPVGTPATLASNEHFVARGVFVRQPGADFRRPRPPFRLDGAAVPPLRPAPSLGQHTGKVPWPGRPAGDRPGGSGAGDRLPLDGVRVVDFTAFWAGPSATHLLAMLGADVVKVESVQRPDGMRLSTARGPDREDRWWEWSPIFQWMNVNKRSVTLDIGQERGRELVLRLIDDADVVIENFSPRVFEQHGLTWDRLRQRNPRLAMVRMPAFGLDGPWRDRTGFAQTMEQLSGMAWLTGYPDGSPMVPKGPVDPTAGIHAAFAIMAALRNVRRTGCGVFVEVPMVETALNVAAELLIEHEAYGRELSRDGNRGTRAAPQGVYPCSGEDEWIAIGVESDDHWRALIDLLDGAGLPDREADHRARRAAHDAIDEAIASWTRGQRAAEVEARLVAAGVPAAEVRSPYDVYGLEPLRERSFVEDVTHPVTGRHGIMTVPFRLDGVGRWIRRPAPLLGEHTAEVLAAVAGVTQADLEDLAAAQVIGTRPVG